MSKIEVNTVDAQCGSTITIGSAGKTVTVPGNIVKSNALQASDAGNIISQCGTTVTLGASGDSVALASGASQTGFGREGSVDWQTGSIKTGTFTAATGEGYFVNTSGGTATVNLPAGAAGSIVAISDYTRTFNSNNCTVAPDGSEKIGGVAQDATLDVDGQSATFVYVDGTEGWINVQETQTSQTGTPPYIGATGGTITCCGDYKIHTFTGPGTFCVSRVSPTPANNAVAYMVAAGGGSGGSAAGTNAGSAAGGGGFREGFTTSITPYTASPLAAACSGITVTASPYSITVGGGGPAPCSPGGSANGTQGSTSSALCISSAGGGAGASNSTAGGDGGSGGGGAGGRASGNAGGSGNTPPVSPAQGFPGGIGGSPAPDRQSGGGGGATVIGTAAVPGASGPGGAGATTSISASPTAYSGGGGGGGSPDTPNCSGCGGAGGGGAGGCGPSGPADGVAGGLNTAGGGGGGGGCNGQGGAGGGGIVIIRYKFQ